MDNNLNLKVKGKFLFKNANLEIDNGITDWGMVRLSGHDRHPCWAVAENFYHLFLGESNAPAHPLGLEKYTMIDPVYERGWVTTGGACDIIHNSSLTRTRTETEVLASGDMIVRFFQSFDVYFSSATTIGEVGVGPAYYTCVKPGVTPPAPVGFVATPDYSTWADYVSSPAYTTRGTLGSNQQRGDEYGNLFGVDAPTRLVHEDNAYHSIFSRAVIPGVKAKYLAGASEEVTYVCEFTVCKDNVGIMSNVRLDTTAVLSATPADQFPDNKTVISQSPFFFLTGKRKPYGQIAGVNRKLEFSGVGRGAANEWAKFGNKHLLCPAFESSAGLDVSNAVEERGVYCLEFFKDGGITNAVGDYSTLQTYMSTDPWVVNDTSGAQIDFPMTTRMLVVPATFSLTRESVHMVHPAKFLKSSIPAAGVWTTKITFQFATDDLIEPIKSFHLIRPLNTNMAIESDWVGMAGVYTIFTTPWSPPADRVVELNYTITWTR